MEADNEQAAVVEGGTGFPSSVEVNMIASDE